MLKAVGQGTVRTWDAVGGADKLRGHLDAAEYKHVVLGLIFLKYIRTELEQLCRRYRVARLELFGSAVAGRYLSGTSDLDFLVEFREHELPGYADRYFDLLESLERLFSAPVDLVVASAVRNPYFRQAVEQHKALLYAA